MSHPGTQPHTSRWGADGCAPFGVRSTDAPRATIHTGTGAVCFTDGPLISQRP